MAMLLSVVVVLATVAVSSSSLFRKYEIDDCIEYAHGINGLVANEIDPSKVDEYLQKGHDAPGYDEVLLRLYRLRDAFPDVEFLYVYRIEPDGCHVVFDLDTDEVPASKPGDVVDFDPSFNAYLGDLLAGNEVQPVISDDKFGHLLTVYKPLYDKDGVCQCYVAVDFLMGQIDAYVQQVLLSVASVSAVFIIGFMVVGYFVAERRIVRPMDRVEDQAYHDALTGVKNKTAYEERAKELDEGIANGSAVFAIFMLDVNFLKRVNDEHGHERGDEYLRACCALMCKVFGEERVYRYGGDEFVAVLEGKELVDAHNMLYDFRKAVRLLAVDKDLEPWERVSMAAGMAVYDSDVDRSSQDVLKRADQKMYENKKAMKAVRED
ncbi:MAG: GGDEF domain-containing protein [Atopobiaceae bacterium]|nr:GGDEF domain-containing protein [Atopobiaceae bacterium]